jgi:polyvinyl alcohol dehydrogenase (cytochrome)
MDSFVALDLKTGAIKWATRVTPFDVWNGNCFVNEPGLGTCPEPRGGDLDFGQGAMLYTATVNGKARDLLAAGQKSGMFWGIDRDSGKVVWGTQVGPGGQSGGTEWGSAADGKCLYIAITNSAFQDWPMRPSGIITTAGMWSALDPATGKILWQTAEPTGSWAFGPVSVANGVVYAGAMDPKGYMGALDAATGEILWSFASGGSVASGSAIADGMVFWGSGYEHLNSPTVHQSVGNDMFYAFEPAQLPRTSRSNGKK